MINEIQTSVENRVMTVRFNRADKKNAITAAMYAALADAFADADKRDDVRVVLITGNGDAFTAGNDLADFQNNPPRGADTPVARFLRQIASMEKPVVAAVNGFAVGVGLTMLLHFDFVYMAEGAKISAPFVDLALVPEAASSLLLPQRIGHAKAAEVFMLGKRVTADEAVHMGIANGALSAEELMPTAEGVALALAKKAPEAVRQTKALMRTGREDVLARMDAESAIFGKQLQSAEVMEAIMAFWEKREPNFG